MNKSAQTYVLGASRSDVYAELEAWRRERKVERLWRGDASLWTGADEGRWLGWLHAIEDLRPRLAALREVTAELCSTGTAHAVVLGMGGSSLCPDVLRRTFAAAAGFPELRVLDSTVPAQIKTLAAEIDPARSIFILSSKSGTTAEPNAFKQYFYERVRQAVGDDVPGSRFVAITDPDTALHKLAKAEHFRHVVHGVASIGGRYSALSPFGMLPAGVMGLDVHELLERAQLMAQSCAASAAPEINPGVALGIIMGTLARSGRDKLTLFISPRIAALGAWLEQLIAESTGKRGRGIVPIDGEALASPEAYGPDRLFVYLCLRGDAQPAQERGVEALERAGHPVVRIMIEDPMDIGQEFFRWEIATAVAGSVLGVNPFDQPDVEASKVATRALMAAYEQTGQLDSESPLLAEGGISFFAEGANAEAIATQATARSPEAYLRAHLARLQAGDYFAINAYLEMSAENEASLQRLRHRVRDAKGVATTLGFGPRFLHSTGQLHKGGANNGVFLQITADDAVDAPIPGQRYTFGVLKRFQAQGDLEVLAERRRRLLRVHLGPDVAAGLKALDEALAPSP